jgi:hypothetical protein
MWVYVLSYPSKVFVCKDIIMKRRWDCLFQFWTLLLKVTFDGGDCACAFGKHSPAIIINFVILHM